MSATEELRRLLDERGVEWMPSAFDPQHETFYKSNGVGLIVTEFPELGRVSLACDMRITPEQAVAATLGPRTCRIKVDADTGCFLVCSECGAIQPEEWTVYYCWCCGARVVKEVDADGQG